jgi:hypothetical protein
MVTAELRFPAAVLLLIGRNLTGNERSGMENFSEGADYRNVPMTIRRMLAWVGAVMTALGFLFCLASPVVQADPLLTFDAHFPFVHRHVSQAEPQKKKKKRSLFGEGPIEIKGNGNVDLGTHRSSLNDVGQSTAEYEGAVTLSLERRTENTATSISQGVGYGSGNSSLGQISANYRTPTYSLDYGLLTGASDTQLQIGGFSRGIGLTKQRPNGTLEFIGAVAFQQTGGGFRALGFRRDIQGRNSSLTYTAIDAIGEGVASNNAIFDAAYKTIHLQNSGTYEIALSAVHGVAGQPDGVDPAFGVAYNGASKVGLYAFSAQDEPHGFASLNTVQVPEIQADLTFKHDLGHSTNVALDFGGDDENSSGIPSSARRASVDVVSQLSRGTSLTLVDSLSTSLSGAPPGGVAIGNITQGIGGILTETIHGTSLSESVQTSLTNGTSGAASAIMGVPSPAPTSTAAASAISNANAITRQFALSASRRAFGGFLTLGASNGTSESAGTFGTFSSKTLSFDRLVGKKLDFDTTLEDTTQSSGGPITRTIASSFSFTRKLSNVISLRVTATQTRTIGPVTSNGTSFSADLVGPIAFGQGVTTGRANPNLPATVQGHVYLIGTSTSLGAGVQQRGFGNVLVVLDNTLTERTDSTGEFEFRFVKPGQHVVALEPATLSSGLVADHAVQSFTVQGGQTQTVDFGVGDFAAIAGRVYAQSGGKIGPISDVTLVVDDLLRVQTGPDGTYSVGRLTQGPHRVAIAPETLPANVSFTEGNDKTVQAVTGTTTTLDFVAQSLGSIAGNVLYTADNGFGDLHGALNVYVVANPGDHAAITDEEGNFLIDDLPPGSYTLTVDPDTIPDDQSVIQGPDGPVVLVPGAKIDGISFKLGAEAKAVTFTFNGEKKAPISVLLDAEKAPPGASIGIVVRTQAKNLKAMHVESDVFGTFPLAFDKGLDAWTGRFIVPSLQKGEYALQAVGEGGEKAVGDASLTVDPTLPLVSVRTSPARAVPGQTVKVIAKILAPAQEGDEVHFVDGYTIKLPKPHGRIFVFDMRMWSHGGPYVGTIVSKTSNPGKRVGSLPSLTIR